MVDTSESGSFDRRRHFPFHASNPKIRFQLSLMHRWLCVPPALQVEKLELIKIARADEVPVVVHGTYRKNWESIGTSSWIRSPCVVPCGVFNHLECSVSTLMIN